MRATYRVVSGLIALAVVFQAAAIAFGTFGVINEIEGGAVVTADSDLPNAGPMLHGIGGTMVIRCSCWCCSSCPSSRRCAAA